MVMPSGALSREYVRVSPASGSIASTSYRYNVPTLATVTGWEVICGGWVTCIVALSEAVPPSPSTVIVYVVVFVGEISREPFTSTAPIPWSISAEVADLEFHVSVDFSPFTIFSGWMLMESVGVDTEVGLGSGAVVTVGEGVTTGLGVGVGLSTGVGLDVGLGVAIPSTTAFASTKKLNDLPLCFTLKVRTVVVSSRIQNPVSAKGIGKRFRSWQCYGLYRP